MNPGLFELGSPFLSLETKFPLEAALSSTDLKSLFFLGELDRWFVDPFDFKFSSPLIPLNRYDYEFDLVSSFALSFVLSHSSLEFHLSGELNKAIVLLWISLFFPFVYTGFLTTP